MQGYNIIIVVNRTGDKVLMCHRTKPPYLGLYNMPGGKVEPGEDLLASAYRELSEETGIRQSQIRLTHLMDFTYPLDDCAVYAYAGKLALDVALIEEEHPLRWVPIDGTDFFSMAHFAGEGNIGHMMEHVRLHQHELFYR